VPISIHLLIFGPPDFAIAVRVRLKPARPAGAGDPERGRLRRELSARLPPRLVRDMLPD
jgi:hypothetical protein